LVYHFGTHEYVWVNQNNVREYEENFDKLSKKCKDDDFKKALEEANSARVDSDHSLEMFEPSPKIEEEFPMTQPHHSEEDKEGDISPSARVEDIKDEINNTAPEEIQSMKVEENNRNKEKEIDEAMSLPPTQAYLSGDEEDPLFEDSDTSILPEDKNKKRKREESLENRSNKRAKTNSPQKNDTHSKSSQRSSKSQKNKEIINISDKNESLSTPPSKKDNNPTILITPEKEKKEPTSTPFLQKKHKNKIVIDDNEKKRKPYYTSFTFKKIK